MSLKARSFDLGLGIRQADISSFDEKQRTAEMVFSTGARVKRFDWEMGPFIEELSLDPAHVKLDRVAAGAVPFLRDHGSWGGASISDVLGRLVSASVDGKVGKGEVKFSSREDVAPVLTDIREGITRSVSVGYRVNKMEKVGEENGVPVLRATDWELFEVSLVAMPADAGSAIRSQRSQKEVQRYACEISGFEEKTGESKNEVATREASPQTVKKQEQEEMTPEQLKAAEEKRLADIAAAKKEAAEAERTRSAGIRKAVSAVGLEDSVAEKMISEGVELDAARAQIIELAAEANRKAKTVTTVVTPGGHDEVEVRRNGIVEGTLHRALPDQFKLTDIGRKWAARSMVEVARELLRLEGVKNTFEMSPSQIVEIAMNKRTGFHSTSDFPKIMEDLQNKSLRAAFAASPQTFAPIVRRVSVSDFKTISRAQLGMGSALAAVGESGEVTYGTMSEMAEKYNVADFAKGFSLSRKAIINDDLDAFGRISFSMGVKARSLESDQVWAILTANAAMSDGTALFHANHGNLGTTGVPSLTTLAEFRKLMRVQKDMDQEPLNLGLRWLIVPAALETVAEQLISVVQPTQASNVNPFAPGGRMPLGLIVEPRLDAASATVYYGATDLASCDLLELATLTGQEQPMLSSEEDFDTMGMKFKVVHSIGVKAIDWRGLVKNP